MSGYSDLLNTQQAAERLNVTKEYLNELLEEGKVPFIIVGEHRKIQLKDLLNFKELKKQQRRDSLRKLTEEAQKLDEEY